ncbi:MAG: glycosyltransferase family 4 protein [Actinobacteria bacterium]|nr:glycosyltransferase family 4 protein [Actinomycetota bacterium]
MACVCGKSVTRRHSSEPGGSLMRIIFLSTPVGPLGSGVGGGVELTMRTLADGLMRRGHEVVVVAPRDSRLGTHRIVEVAGVLHVPSQTLDRTAPLVVPTDSVLVNMWNTVVELARSGQHDVVLNFAYDALPFVNASECAIPVAHLVSMGSLSDEMDRAVALAARSHAHAVAMHSRAQAATFGPTAAERVTIVASGVELSNYEFVAAPTDALAFVARISPEKGIRDAFAVAARTRRRLRVFGVMEDRKEWDAARAQNPHADVEHVGFLPTRELQAQLGTCAALIMVHRWVEAFGNVAIEALACGVPVITYDRGGPAEIVRDGATGFVVPADDVVAVAAAVERVDAIDRLRCRADVRERFSAESFAARVEEWLVARLA